MPITQNTKLVAAFVAYALLHVFFLLVAANPAAHAVHSCAAAFPSWDGELAHAPGIVWALIVGDLEIFAAYMVIAAILLRYAMSSDGVAFPDLILAFSAFIFLCGITHLVKIAVIFKPLFAFEAGVEAACAMVSVFALLVFLTRYRTMVSLDKARLALQVMTARDVTELRAKAVELEELMKRDQEAHG